MTTNPVTRDNAIQHHDVHPLILDLLLTHVYTSEWWHWEPETLRMMLPRQFKGGPSELAWNKMQAVRTIHVSTDMVLNEWEVFLPVITALNNVAPDFNILQLPPMTRLYAGVRMLHMFDAKFVFSEEVRRFIAMSLLHEGIYFAPGELEFVQFLLRRPYYKCTDCGYQQDVLFEQHDGICDWCGKNWHDRVIGTPIRTDPHVTYHTRYDEKPVREKYEKVIQDWESYTPHDDNEIDIQVCKVANAVNYSLLRDQQFLEQKSGLDL